MNYKEYFTNIYDNNIWGEGSGGGSSIESTVLYREYLQKFLKEKNISSVIDYGCGDWQSSHLINFDGIEYLGIDCVDSVIDNNTIKYSKDNIKFKVLYQLEEFFDYKADLLILKDIIQHWTNQEVDYFLPNVIKNFKYVLLNNSSHQSFDNQDGARADARARAGRPRSVSAAGAIAHAVPADAGLPNQLCYGPCPPGLSAQTLQPAQRPHAPSRRERKAEPLHPRHPGRSLAGQHDGQGTNVAVLLGLARPAGTGPQNKMRNDTCANRRAFERQACGDSFHLQIDLHHASFCQHWPVAGLDPRDAAGQPRRDLHFAARRRIDAEHKPGDFQRLGDVHEIQRPAPFLKFHAALRVGGIGSLIEVIRRIAVEAIERLRCRLEGGLGEPA